MYLKIIGKHGNPMQNNNAPHIPGILLHGIPVKGCCGGRNNNGFSGCSKFLYKNLNTILIFLT